MHDILYDYLSTVSFWYGTRTTGINAVSIMLCTNVVGWLTFLVIDKRLVFCGILTLHVLLDKTIKFCF